MLALVGRARRVEAGGEGQHRLAVQPRHQREQRRTVDAARQEHAVRHVAALMQIDAFLQRAVQPVQRRVLVDVLRPALGDRGETRRRSRMWPSAQVMRLARQHALDAFEDRVGARW